MLAKFQMLVLMWLLMLLSLVSLSLISCGDDESNDNGDGSDGDTDGDADVTFDISVKDACVGGELDESKDPPLCTLESKNITKNSVWINDVAYYLSGRVFIGDGESKTALHIEPGTTIFGNAGLEDGAALIIQRNAKIFAEGEVDNPIVFTSSKPDGERAPGDWGGLVLNGKAPINICDTPDKACESEGEGETGKYGGLDPDDNSGVLKYVRIEFSGKRLTEESEFNGLTLQGVGSGTQIEYIQIHRTSDDSMEFFGGTARVRHMLLTGCGDDGFDWTQGWSGKAQYVIIEQASDIEADRGIEADSFADNNDARPRANPTLFNFTIIGAPDNANDGILGMMLREGTAGTLRNFVITGFDTCIDIDQEATWEQVADGKLTLDYAMVDAEDCFKVESDDPETTDVDESTVEGALVKDDFWDLGEHNTVGDPELDGWVPKSGSPVLSGGADGTDSWFDDAGFIGAVGDEDWTEGGWTDFPKN